MYEALAIATFLVWVSAQLLAVIFFRQWEQYEKRESHREGFDPLVSEAAFSERYISESAPLSASFLERLCR